MSEAVNIPQLRFPEFSGEWESTKVGRISNKIVAGGTPSTLKVEYWGGDIRWMSSGELNYKKVFEVEKRITTLGLNKSSTKEIPEHCILIGLAGQGKTRGTVAMNMLGLCINQSIAAIHPNNNVFDFNFLYHNLDNRYDELRRLSTGEGGRGGLNLQIIKTLDISLPTKLEQQKIAAFLTAVDNKIEKLSKKQALLGEYKKGLMQQIFSQEIRFKADDGSDFPDWEEKKLGDVCKLQGGYAFKSAEFQKHGIPIIRISNISNNNDFIDNRNLVYYNEIKNSDKFIIKNGDLIVAMSGATTGKSSIYNLIEDAYLNQRVGLFKANNSLLDYGFLIQIVFSYIFATQLDSVLVAGAQPNVSSKDIEGFEISLPSKIEQNKIANFLSSIDSKIEQVGKQLDESKQFKKALLQQMFV
jgi:type I restriction enzyme S subunit